MKKDLLGLIDQIDHIKSFFHITGGKMLQNKIIYNTMEFASWKQEIQLELQDIFDRTNDNFIWSILVILNQGFNGWNDEKAFNDLSGGLLAISKNIHRYYLDENKVKDCEKEVISMNNKIPKIFISHSSNDKVVVNYLVEFLDDIGLNEKQIFCSSIPGYGIPLNEDIYDYLKEQFLTHKLHVIFVLSSNYYNSVACLNEMGAAWVLQSNYTTLILPGFDFKEIQGAINPRQIGLKMDSDIEEVKDRLGQLRDTLIEEFGLSIISDVRWEKKRDTFISKITSLTKTKISNNTLHNMEVN